ncbi:hypothetical protein LY78DRAFT_293267 [Colletotrichum sublineola]|nr:hypothetical protein LY78DRAFT_293267 [Colletotrichum sublineola]
MNLHLHSMSNKQTPAPSSVQSNPSSPCFFSQHNPFPHDHPDHIGALNFTFPLSLTDLRAVSLRRSTATSHSPHIHSHCTQTTKPYSRRGLLAGSIIRCFPSNLQELSHFDFHPLWRSASPSLVHTRGPHHSAFPSLFSSPSILFSLAPWFSTSIRLFPISPPCQPASPPPSVRARAKLFGFTNRPPWIDCSGIYRPGCSWTKPCCRP